jgi:hypothetical protein
VATKKLTIAERVLARNPSSHFIQSTKKATLIAQGGFFNYRISSS